VSRLSIRAPLIAGGLSQQAATNRFPGQVEAASNADFTVQDGITKRRGTRFEALLTGLTGSGNYRVEPIIRDETERYLTVIGPNGANMGVRVYNSTGTAQTVNITSAAQTYLNAGTPTADDIRVRSSGDYTIIVNSKATPAGVNSPAYAISRTVTNYDMLLSWWGTSGQYHKTTLDDDQYSASNWLYTIGAGGGQFGYTENATDGGAISTLLSQFNTPANNPYGVDVYSNRSITVNGSWTDSTRRITSTNAFQGYVWKSGDQLNLTGGTGVVLGWYTITAKISDSIVELSADINGGGGDIASGVLANSIRRRTTATAFLSGSSSFEEALSKMNRAIRAAGSDLVLFYNPAPANKTRFVNEFKGTVATSVTNIGTAAGATNNLFTTLVASASSVAGTGTLSTTLLDTFPIASRWSRVSPPNDANASFNAQTMPIAMRRTTFGSPSTFDIDVIAWTPRYTGDNNTNPAPKIVSESRPISDVAFWNDRLVLLGGQYLAMSGDGDYFNFYADDATNITDADPIQRTLSTDQVAIGDRIVPIRESLLIFTKAGRQFEITSIDSAPTPTSVAVTASTAYQSSGTVPPVPMHNYVYFATTAGNFSAIREYGYQPEAAALSAPSITEHVPTLLPSGLRRMVAHPQTSSLIVLPASGQTIYAHRSFWNGPRREQSAWTTYAFDASYRFCDLAVIGDRCYALVESQSQYVLESWPLSEEASPSGHAYPPLIDRCMNVSGGSFGSGNTTWTLPSSLSDTTINRVVTTAGVEYPATCSGTTLTVAGVNLASGTHQAGRSYAMSVQLTEPYLRDEQGRVDLTYTPVVHTVTTHHRNSYAYSLRADYTDSGVSDNTVSLVSTVPDSRGEVALSVFCLATGCNLFIESSSAAPCAISSIEIDVQPFLTLR